MPNSDPRLSGSEFRKMTLEDPRWGKCVPTAWIVGYLDRIQSARTAANRRAVMQCIYNGGAVFDWDANNLRKIRAHRINADEVEKAPSNDPFSIYEQDVEGGNALRLLRRGRFGTNAGRSTGCAAKQSESSPRTTWMLGTR